MSQKKVVVNVTRSRKTSEGSSTKSSLTRLTPATPNRKSAVGFHEGKLVDGERRDSLGQLLTLPADFGRRKRSYSWQGHPIRKFERCLLWVVCSCVRR